MQHSTESQFVPTRVHLAGYGLGATVAFEMAARRNDLVRSLCMLDGSMPSTATYMNRMASAKLAETEAEFLYAFAQQYVSQQVFFTKAKFIVELAKLACFDERIKFVVRELINKSQFQFEPIDLEKAARSYVLKSFKLYKYKPSTTMRLPEILVIKTGQRINLAQAKIEEESRLASVFGGKVKVDIVEADHRSFLEGKIGMQVADLINEYLSVF